MTDSNRPRWGYRLATVKAYIMAHPFATNSEIIKATACSQKTISTARGELRKEGFAPRLNADRRSRPFPLEGAPDPTPATPATPEVPEIIAQTTKQVFEMLDAADPGDEWTIPQQRQWLMRLVKNVNEPYQLRMAALVQYNKLSENTSERDALGPGAPLNDKERIMRLSLLMRACGPKLTLRAYEEAFNVSAEEENVIEAVDSGSTAAEATSTSDAEGHDSSLPTTSENHSPSGLGEGPTPDSGGDPS